MSKRYTLAIDVGGTKVLGVVFDEQREIVAREKKKTKEMGDDAGDISRLIITVARDLIRETGIDESEFRAVSAGVPGVVDSDHGVVLFTPNLPWRDFDLKSVIEKELGIPFFVGNDVNFGTLGEHRYGAVQGLDNVVGFFVGTGVGGGLILGGRLFTGRGFRGGEFGHMVLNTEGPLCNCGQRGCLEAFASKTALTRYTREQLARGRSSMLAPYVEDGVVKSKKIKKALIGEDLVTMEAVRRAGHYLAVATGNMINTISPDAVVYGGGVFEAVGDIFMEIILSEVDRYCMPSIREGVRLERAALGDDSVIYGALAAAEDALM